LEITKTNIFELLLEFRIRASLPHEPYQSVADDARTRTRAEGHCGGVTWPRCNGSCGKVEKRKSAAAACDQRRTTHLVHVCRSMYRISRLWNYGIGTIAMQRLRVTIIHPVECIRWRITIALCRREKILHRAKAQQKS